MAISRPPLFIHQMTYIWCDFRGIQDAFMRQHGSDYFENSCSAAHIQQQYAMHNPLDFEHVDEFCWGATASDGPGDMKKCTFLRRRLLAAGFTGGWLQA